MEQTDGMTMLEALKRLEAAGFRDQFSVCPDGEVSCGPCGRACPAEDMTVLKMLRTEGVSDPADETMILGLTCMSCHKKGTLVVPYGPRMGANSGRVVELLQFARRASVPAM